MTETHKPQPWNIHKKYATFPEADAARKTLISKGFETRVIRRHRDETFDVKKRPTVAMAEVKKEKKPRKKKK